MDAWNDIDRGVDEANLRAAWSLPNLLQPVIKVKTVVLKWVIMKDRSPKH
jgi:hypothetical protein